MLMQEWKNDQGGCCGQGGGCVGWGAVCCVFLWCRLQQRVGEANADPRRRGCRMALAGEHSWMRVMAERRYVRLCVVY